MVIEINPYIGNYPESAMEMLRLTADEMFDNMMYPSPTSCTPEVVEELKGAVDLLPFLDTSKGDKIVKGGLCEAFHYWQMFSEMYPIPEHNEQNLPSLKMFVDFQSTWHSVKKARDVVAQLRTIPHNKGHYREYEYHSSVWDSEVIPLIGSTKEYDALVLGATYSFKYFVNKYDDMQIGWQVGNYKGPFTPPFGLVNIESFPILMRPAARAITMMMSEIVAFQNRRGGSQIECDGGQCPEDDESEKMSLPLGRDLCYTNDATDDGHCYNGPFNPHVYGWGVFLIGDWMTDSRTDETEFVNFYTGEPFRDVPLPRAGGEKDRWIQGLVKYVNKEYINKSKYTN
jgi:hypothetical protein